MKDIKYIIIFVLFFGKIIAQGDSVMLRNASDKMLKKLGKNALQQNDPSNAIFFLETYVPKNKKDAESKMLLGFAYMEIRDYERAQNMFLNAYTTDQKKAPEALYYHALMMKSNAQYDSARYNFGKFKKEYKGKNKNLKRYAAKQISFCDSLIKLMAIENKIIVNHLDTTINKINSEGAPVNLNDSVLIYTSLRTDKKEYIIEDDTASGIKRKIYYATRKGEQWKFEGEYGNDFNDEGSNVGNVSFNFDHTRMYFTRCKLNYLDKRVCAIYVSEKQGDGWSEPEKLPKPVNQPLYTSTMPGVARDPVKGYDIIYFVSNRPKGKGGLDIWYTVYNKKTKTYKEPKNAGSKINTSQNEISPFYDNETRTLYFSSEGWGGFGGYDVLKTTSNGKKWSGTENMGRPINSGADDMFYTISVDRSEGFFVSNRKGGNALKNSTCCDDIYFYKHTEYINLSVKGLVAELTDPFLLIPDATIELYLKDKTTGEKFLVKTTKTDSLGRYNLKVEAGQDYYLVVKKDEYLGSSEDLSTKNITQSGDLTVDLGLVKRPKEAVHIPNVLYEFAQSSMVESSKLSLDTTVLRLMENNPELIIEIQSHTDNKGNDAFNMKLSQKRAETVVKYLTSKGVDPKRLKAKGYGESKPIAPNENPDGSDNPEGRAKNRRTDFKIIGVVDAEIINASEVE